MQSQGNLHEDHLRILKVLPPLPVRITLEEISYRIKSTFNVTMSANNIGTRMSDKQMKPYVHGEYPKGKRYKVWGRVQTDQNGQTTFLEEGK